MAKKLSYLCAAVIQAVFIVKALLEQTDMSRKDNKEKKERAVEGQENNVKNTTDSGVAGRAGVNDSAKGKCGAEQEKDLGRQDGSMNDAAGSEAQNQQEQQEPQNQQEPQVKQLSAEELLKNELAEQKDRYLRLSAEFDNYRRRVAKEKLELIETAGEGVIKSLLPVVDDFERAIKALEGTTDAESAKEGTNLIYKKLQELLKSRGVSEIETEGKELDTDVHEAVAQFPAPDPKLKGKIMDCVQKGYRLGGKVIRFAKVVVGV